MIPPITDPMSRSWPVRNTDVTVFRDKAIVTQRVFDLLPEYSTTQPTGVYPGKIWKSNEWHWDPTKQFRVSTDRWHLCWFDDVPDKPGYCRTLSLLISVANPKA